MKYAALLTNHADDVAAWEKLTPEEAAAARAEEVPKWEALFGELGPTGVLGAGSELDSPRPRRRSASATARRSSPTAPSPRRRSRSAA